MYEYIISSQWQLMERTEKAPPISKRLHASVVFEQQTDIIHTYMVIRDCESKT